MSDKVSLWWRPRICCQVQEYSRSHSQGREQQRYCDGLVSSVYKARQYRVKRRFSFYGRSLRSRFILTLVPFVRIPDAAKIISWFNTRTTPGYSHETCLGLYVYCSQPHTPDDLLVLSNPLEVITIQNSVEARCDLMPLTVYYPPAWDLSRTQGMYRFRVLFADLKPHQNSTKAQTSYSSR
ncbi:hypothetical protein H2248_005649 [Termitomyces sp. 'cryptogamus']|nr:hypothetical protein H2248_005649 [Termitomyces sp. 'cryptogamus']